MNRLSKENWILYWEKNNGSTCCDVCDKVDDTIHFSILGNVYVLCKDCVKELNDTLNGKHE